MGYCLISTEAQQLSEAFIKHPHYFHYFNKVMQKPDGAGMERRPREGGFRKPVKRKEGKKLDDIYD